MPFTGFDIPNEADAIVAGHPALSEIDSADFQILVSAFQGQYVVAGCRVTQQTSPNMTVKIINGVIAIDPQRVKVAAQTSPTIVADATNPRYVLIEVTLAGALVVNAGTAAVSPIFPTPTLGNVVLAVVAVNANATSIVQADIVDKRIIKTDTFETAASLLYLDHNFD